MKKLFLLALAFALTLLCASALADDAFALPASLKAIKAKAFMNDASITELVIPDGCVSIGDFAFSGCANLTTVTIPESVTHIGENAFAGCSELTDVYYAGTEEQWNNLGISENAIPQNLAAIHFTDSAEIVDSGTWGQLTWTLNSEGLLVISGNGGMDDFSSQSEDAWRSNIRKIKKMVLGDGVTSIGESAFYECFSLTSVTIPNSVTSIGSSAFSYSGLKNVTIPGSVTSIGDDAFHWCSSLTSVTIPDSVTSIGSSAFSYSGLKNVTIPDSVTSIGDGAFAVCTSLSNIVLSEQNERYAMVDGALYSKDMKSILCFPAGRAETTFTIPASVTSIGDDAFRGCSSLTSVTIPDSVTSIGEWAFHRCSSLTSVTIPESVTSIGGYAFYWCSSLTSVTIPDSVTSIGEGAFSGCSSLTSITIPENVTSISRGAFYWCSSLTSVTIPESVTSIGSTAFYECSGLTSVTIPESVTSIGVGAFDGCSSLTSITIPESVTSIGVGAFGGCSSLTSITIPESVTSIGEGAFSGCSSLTSVTIPESVTSIGWSVFSECSGLTSITIPESVTSIGGGAFSGCSGLTSITIPESVTSIGWGAFSGCSSLTSITIPESVTSIGDDAFRGCGSLTSITIPESVTSIGVGAFDGCRSLTSVNLNGYSVYLYNYFKTNCTTCKVYIWNQGTGSYQDMDSYYDMLNSFWAAYAIPSSQSVYTNDTVKVTASIFGGTGSLTYSYQLQYEDNIIQNSGWVSSSEYTFLCAQAGRYKVILTGKDEGGKQITCESEIILAVDPPPAQQTEQQTEMQQAILGTMTYMCDNVLSPDYTICVMKDDTISPIHMIIYALEDVVNFNFSDLNWTYNKTKYLFEDAIKRCSTTRKMNLFNKDIIVTGSLKDSMDLLDNATSFNIENLYDAFDKMCDQKLLQKLKGESVEGLLKDYMSGKNGLDDLTNSLKGVGMKDQDIGSVVSKLDWLKDLGTVAEALGAIENGKRIFDSCINVLNQMNLMNSLDEAKMLAVAQIYQASADPVMRLVGQKLSMYYNASKHTRIALIATGELVDVGLEFLTGKCVETACSAFTGSFLATVKLTDAAINVLFGVGDIPGKIYEINFSADAARSSYKAFTDAYIAYKASQNDTTLSKLCYAYINYHEVSSKAEEAYVALYKVIEDSVLGNTLITDEMRETMNNAKRDGATMKLFADRMDLLYDLWKSGDYPAFKQGLEKLNQDYQEAIQAAGA